MASVVPALLRRELPDWMPDPVRGARVVVLLVVDGLGWHSLGEHAARTPTLSGMVGGPITTVVPSTTAAALTSITTGLAPAAHGVLGYRIVVDDDVLDVLGHRLARGRRPPDPFTVQRHAPFLGREVPVVSASTYRGSGFTQVHLRDTRYVGYRTESTLVEHLRHLARGDDTFVYAYTAGVDEVAHAFGLHDGYYAAEVAATDRLVTEILDALPGDAALVVTADHGQSHVGPDGWRRLGALESLIPRPRCWCRAWRPAAGPEGRRARPVG